MNWLEDHMSWLEMVYYGNSVLAWGTALFIAAAVLFALLIVKGVLIARLKALSRRTSTKFDDHLVSGLRATRSILLAPLAIYVGSQDLELPVKVANAISHVAVVALLIQVALWVNRFAENWIAQSIQEKREQDAAGATTLGLLRFFASVAVWSIALLLALDNLGFNITALIAGMGIGGVAVALAAQNILGDLFASLSIVLDKPFIIGDFIVVGDQAGTVEYIGLKTTRIRSLGGEQIVFSNADLLQSRIRNYKRMQERRVVFSFGVIYQTSHEQLKKIPVMVKDIITQLPDRARFDRAHFKEYGDSSLNFEVVFYVLSADYNVYMDTQQTINLEIFRRFAQAGIDFAYPTRTLYMTRLDKDARAEEEFAEFDSKE